MLNRVIMGAFTGWALGSCLVILVGFLFRHHPRVVRGVSRYVRTMFAVMTLYLLWFGFHPNGLRQFLSYHRTGPLIVAITAFGYLTVLCMDVLYIAWWLKARRAASA